MTSTTPPKRHAGARRRWILIGGWSVVAALVLIATWGGLIAIELMTAFMTVISLFAGDSILPFAPDWAGLALHLAALAAAVGVAWRLRRYQRISSGRCGRCGRGDAPPADRRRLARRLALIAIVPAGGYAALKLYWGFGGTFGLDDPNAFAGVHPWTPGFGDTAVEAAIGVLAGIVMAYRWRVPRFVPLAVGALGCAMLLPVAVYGNIGNIASLFGAGHFGMGLSAWVGWFVYGCFATWGACLAFVTVEYWYATRGECPTCGRGVPGSRA